MSSRKPRRGPPSPRGKAAKDAAHEVGYGKPPQAHRFKPGQCGNPKGRPKGAKNTTTLVREVLDRKIEIRIAGTARKISVREAMITRFAESALKGDTKSAAFLLQRYDMPATTQEHANSGGTPEDQELIAEYLRDLSNRREQE